MNTAGTGPQTKKAHKSSVLKAGRRTWFDWVVFAVLLLLSVLMVLPSIHMLSTAFKTRAESLRFPPTLIPDTIVTENFTKLFELDFVTWYQNSLMIGILTVTGTVLSSAFVAYGFSRYRAKGKNILFAFLLATMMLPYPAVMIPQFILFKQLGWVDSFLPLIVPAFLGSAYFIFLLRQFYTSLSGELFEAAKVDGCSEIRQWWSIALPLSGPALATVAIFSFIWSWNDLLGQVLYLNSTEKFTLPIGMAGMVSSTTRPPSWNVVMAASLLAIVPILVLFSTAQRYFVQSIVLTGVK
ncbi:carbohydrate ABC transporter permease [Paenibacillus sp. FJAT-26967]|uniref:carbohydrate ABC transporter permease n=1 Tax=Paenibacillus sp. FJAT-26967 TaxID=1729690 RepID=UPI000838046F|nr:carbohydrate ABC transporter permease [Paenibacillus sp. FJAT-26967]